MAWYLWDYWLWTILQIYLAIICASAPALRPLVHLVFVNPLLELSRAKSQRSTGTPDSRAQLARYAQNPELSETVVEDEEAELEFITVPDEMKKSTSNDLQNEMTTTTTSTTLSRASTLGKMEQQQHAQQQRASTVGITTISSTIAMLRNMTGAEEAVSPDPRSSVTVVTNGRTRTSGGFTPWPRTPPDLRSPTSERGWPLSPEAVEVMRTRSQDLP